MNFKTKFLWLVLPIFILSACNLQLVESPQDPNDANLELTAIVQQMLIDQAAQQGNVVEITATPQPGSVQSAPPTEEAVVPAAVLPPATGDVTVTVSVATNCRQGPGTAFASIYGMPVGQVAKVVAKNSYSGYWIIEIPGQAGQTCWLWGQYATINGDMAGLKDVVTPTSVATNTPTATIAPTITNTVAAAAPAVAGCTDSTASNYNSAATVDDGSCAYIGPAFVGGCTDPNAINYNPNANADDGSCGYPAPIITSASVVCEDQFDGNYKFIITVHWKPADPGLSRIARTTVGMLNGKEVYKSGTSMKVSINPYSPTLTLPAGTVVTVTFEKVTSTSLTCP